MKSKRSLMTVLVGLAMLATPITAAAKDHDNYAHNNSHAAHVSRSSNAPARSYAPARNFAPAAVTRREFRNNAVAARRDWREGPRMEPRLGATPTITATTATPATTRPLSTRLLSIWLPVMALVMGADRTAPERRGSRTPIITTGTPAIPRPPMICSVRISGHSVAAVQADRLTPADYLVDTVECPRTTTTADTTAVTASLTAQARCSRR